MVLTMNLVMQMLERMRTGDRAPARANMLGLITQKALDQLRRSVGPRLSLATAGRPVYIYTRLLLKFHRVAFSQAILPFFKFGRQGTTDYCIWG